MDFGQVGWRIKGTVEGSGRGGEGGEGSEDQRGGEERWDTLRPWQGHQVDIPEKVPNRRLCRESPQAWGPLISGGCS